MTSTVHNQFLTGDYAPVRDEITLTELSVTGTIPEQLSGRYVRIGPNPVAEVDPIAHHWFMGDGMVHGVRIRDGRAEWYRNRFVRTPAVARKLGEAAPRRISARAGMLQLPANTNIIEHAGRTLALIEGGAANYELTDELDTVGTCDFGGTLFGGYTAHPHRDPDTGELHAISYSAAKGRSVEYSVIGADGRARRTVEIPTHGAPMMHDFAFTKKYVLVYDLPCVLDPAQLGQMVGPAWLAKPASMVLGALVGRVKMPSPLMALTARLPMRVDRLPYRWKADYPARIGVLPRDGGTADVRWFDIDPCYVFHTLNAYDETDVQGNERIVLDLVRHEKMFDEDLNGPTEGNPALERWTVELDSGKVRADRFDDRNQEFPRCDERLAGKPHRYGYSVSIGELGSDGGFDVNKVLRHDFHAGRTQTREFGSHVSLGEVVFVPTGSGEDEGVLVGYAFDRERGETDLLFLDSQTLETVASVHLPVRVPTGFHGNWLAD